MNPKKNSLECLQDGLFFGLEYLKTKLTPSDFSTFFKDGSLILKGQKAFYREEESQKENIAFLLSYLSGAYTLVSCFTGRNFPFKIGATVTKDFIHKEGEEHAILKAGAVLSKESKEPVRNLEYLLKELKKTDPKDCCFLSEKKISRQEIKQTLETFPEQDFNVEGHFLPSDLEKWRGFKNIKTVQPYCLQGNFPLLKMQWTN